jgi:hypothetical protein
MFNDGRRRPALRESRLYRRKWCDCAANVNRSDSAAPLIQSLR